MDKKDSSNIDSAQKILKLDDWDRAFGFCVAAAKNYDSQVDVDFVEFTKQFYHEDENLARFIEAVPLLAEGRNVDDLLAPKKKTTKGNVTYLNTAHSSEKPLKNPRIQMPEWMMDAVAELKMMGNRLQEAQKWTKKMSLEEDLLRRNAALTLACLMADKTQQRKKGVLLRRFIVQNEEVFLRDLFNEGDMGKTGNQWNLWALTRTYAQQVEKELKKGGTLKNFFDYHHANNQTLFLEGMLNVTELRSTQKNLRKQITELRARQNSIPIETQESSRKPFRITRPATSDRGDILTIVSRQDVP
ncbi:MAG: hypothetical protein ACOY3I_02755 [Verrucomicrobiota bacterium]